MSIMGETYELVFNKTAIYDMFFFNIKSVAKYRNLDTLKEQNILLYNEWIDIFNKSDKSLTKKEFYLKNVVNYPEFSKIAIISYANLYVEDGKLKRNLKVISHENEVEIIKTFIDVLNSVTSDGLNSSPQYMPVLCGHNITMNDIPLFIKRCIFHREELKKDEKELPVILKSYLSSKPWESNCIDTSILWKLKGIGTNNLSLLSNFLNLKKKVELLTPNKLSEYYWENIDTKPEETMDYLSLQSATQTNLVIQLINELRQI